jgi:hypothetical protein
MKVADCFIKLIHSISDKLQSHRHKNCIPHVASDNFTASCLWFRRIWRLILVTRAVAGNTWQRAEVIRQLGFPRHLGAMNTYTTAGKTWKEPLHLYLAHVIAIETDNW